MLSQRDLYSLRRVFALSLPDLATRQTRTTAADLMGGVTETWASTYNIPCRLSALSARGLSQADQFVIAAGWRALLPHDQTMAAGDRMVVASRTYEVLSVEDSVSERIGRVAYLRRID